MDVEAVRAILATIRQHLEGRTGEVVSVSIKDGQAFVRISWTTFQSAFSGQTANVEVGSGSARWTRSIGDITYFADQISTGGQSVVP